MPDRESPATILAFDFGQRRIGVAVGQSVTASASPLGVIRNGETGPDHERIAELVAEWRPRRLIVGLPLHADGRASDMSDIVRGFAADLEAHGLPVELVDERHTSQEAGKALLDARQQGRRGRIRKQDIDAAAAVLIAERYLAGIDSEAP